MNKYLNIILWILFWWYRLPYFLFNKYVFHGKRQKLWSNLATIFALIILINILPTGSHDDSKKATSSETKIHYVVKKDDLERLDAAKSKSKTLDKQEEDKQSEYDKLQEQVDEQEAQSSSTESSASSAATVEVVPKKKANTHKTVSQTNDSTDVVTGQGKIIGNMRSHIYHVPGQAGYHMHSANAIYFNSEQEAINAGYRKAKR